MTSLGASLDTESPPVLSARAITHGGRRGRPALDDVGLEVHRGELLALAGPNGAGKSTLLKILAGLLRPDSGRVIHAGRDLLELEVGRRSGVVAYVGADLRVEFPLRAAEAVLLGAVAREASGVFSHGSPEERRRCREAMERCRCWHLRDRDVRSLSDGERQLVNLARALVQGARVLLLDEALSRMDLNHQAVVGELLSFLAFQERYAIVLVSHDLNLATEWAKRCVLLAGGKVVADGPTAAVVTAERLAALYPGASLLVAPHPRTGVPKVFFEKTPRVSAGERSER